MVSPHPTHFRLTAGNPLRTEGLTRAEASTLFNIRVNRAPSPGPPSIGSAGRRSWTVTSVEPTSRMPSSCSWNARPFNVNAARRSGTPRHRTASRTPSPSAS